MKRALTLFFMVLVVYGCDRYPSHLQPSEQVQALIFEHLTAEIFRSPKAGDDALRLFLCYGNPLGDPSPAVLAHVSRSYRSARRWSDAAERVAFENVNERYTGLSGIELRLEPFTLTGDGPLTIRASYLGGPGHGKEFEYHIQRVKSRWKILKREQLRIY